MQQTNGMVISFAVWRSTTTALGHPTTSAPVVPTLGSWKSYRDGKFSPRFPPLSCVFLPDVFPKFQTTCRARAHGRVAVMFPTDSYVQPTCPHIVASVTVFTFLTLIFHCALFFHRRFAARPWRLDNLAAKWSGQLRETTTTPPTQPITSTRTAIPGAHPTTVRIVHL